MGGLYRGRATAPPLQTIILVSLAQLQVSALSRYGMMLGPPGAGQSAVDAWSLAVNMRQDVTIIGIAAGLAWAAVIAAKRKSQWVVHVLQAFACLHCLLLAANGIFVRWVGTPLTVEWLYLADWFRSSTPRIAWSAVVTPSDVASFVLAGVLPLLAVRLLGPTLSRVSAKTIRGAGGAAFILTGAVASSMIVRPTQDVFPTNSWESPLVSLSRGLVSSHSCQSRLTPSK